LPTAEAVVGRAPETTTPSMIRYAVVCSVTDPSGPWARAALERRGLAGVRLVTEDEIAYSTRLVHRQSSGSTTTEITLPDGAVLGPDLHAVLNRVVAVPSAHLAGSQQLDRDYALQEMYALLTSVLASLPGVVNAAGPRGLAGPWLGDAEWFCEAARAGLPGVGLRSAQPVSDLVEPDRSVLVIGAQVLPVGRPGVSVSEPVARGCRALAERVGARVLGVDFVAGDAGWLFVRANPVPDLRWGGEPVAVALADLLTRGAPP
jgi:hypothetical protein